MQLITCAKPYVNAIFALAQENDNHSSWNAVLQAGSEMSSDPTLQAFITTPNIDKATKIKEIIGLFKSILNRILTQQEQSFVGLVLTNNRFNALPNMLTLFTKLTNDATATKAFHLSSAYPLNAQTSKKIERDLALKYAAKVQLDTSVNKNLLGGVVIKQDDEVLDLSIKARVDGLKSCLSL